MKTSGIIILLVFVFFSLSCEKTTFYNPYNQLQEDIQKIDAYLEENNIVATKSSSGLRYVIVDEGLGSNPVRGNKVSVHYTGKLFDGKVFDSSYDRGEPFSYTHGISQVIQGWDEGLSYIGERGKITLYVPSVLAYGSRGSGTAIGPHENLMFDVELLSVQ
ncbi:MAG: FKBP-type peptidyl-prolyl cis-trans isomerase [Cyclobacteriaceae bacterium]|nr:FKBP-type peptidyl-prolyl cis-trans isomerase [Cyclobacteriaceae bacterium]